MVTFRAWGWREKQKDILERQSPGRVLQERSCKMFRNGYRKTRVQEPFLKEISECRPTTLFNKRLIHRFFFWNFQNSSEQLFYSTAVNRCLWFNWIVGNFDHNLSFKQMPENFDHHSWFYRKYLEFRRSYETIWKRYLEHDIA